MLTSRNDLHETETSSSFTSTGTFTSESTVPGLGYLTGRGLKRVGNVVISGVDAIIIRRRLAQIESLSSRIVESSSLRPLYSDLLELCRPVYRQSIRTRAFRLIMAKIGGMEFDDLALVLLDQRESDIRDILEEIFLCLRSAREDEMQVPAFRMAGLKDYEARVPYAAPWCTFYTPFMLFLSLTISLSLDSIFSRILMEQGIIAFVMEIYPSIRSDIRVKIELPQVFLPVELVFRALLQKLDHVQDISAVSELNGILDSPFGFNTNIWEPSSSSHPLSLTDDILKATRSAVADLSTYPDSPPLGVDTRLRKHRWKTIRSLVPKGSGEDITLAARNNAIEIQLKKARTMLKNEVRVLAMGAGASGSASALNKMMVLDWYMKGKHHEQQRVLYKKQILIIVVRTMIIILNILHRAELNVDQRNRVHLATLLSLPPQIEDILLSQNIIHAVSCLWKDPVVKEAIRSPRELPIDRTSIYFMDSLDRVSSHDYLPSLQDIFLCRKNSMTPNNTDGKTSTITEFSWKVDELTYKFLLIGTQQLERRKWVQIFENVTAFMFLVNISEYDQVLHEDGSVNRTQEALNVFGHICNSQWFPKTPIILFMNEADVLMEKLPRAPLRDYFPDYTGKDNYDAAREYLLHRFISLNEGPVIKQIYPFYVSESGDDIMFLQYLLNTVQDILLDSHLRECGLV